MTGCLIVFITSIIISISGALINAFGKNEDQGILLEIFGIVIFCMSSIVLMCN